MSGFVGNYIFAYGFILTDISDSRYFIKGSMPESEIDLEDPFSRYYDGASPEDDMVCVTIKKKWKKFISGVGWFNDMDIFPDEQSKIYVFGEHILSCERGSFEFSKLYDIRRDVYEAKLKHKGLIDKEAEINCSEAAYLFFMNDSSPAGWNW